MIDVARSRISENAVVSNKDATWCLALNKNVAEAVKILLKNSKKKTLAYLGLMQK